MCPRRDHWQGKHRRLAVRKLFARFICLADLSKSMTMWTRNGLSRISTRLFLRPHSGLGLWVNADKEDAQQVHAMYLGVQVSSNG